VKVILANAALTDELKIIGCRCCERAEVDFVTTSRENVALMRKHLPEEIGVKVADGVGTVEELLELVQAGVGRVGTGSAVQILDEWKTRLAAAT
jgi:deoxyribose-phosphate aldolase